MYAFMRSLRRSLVRSPSQFVDVSGYPHIELYPAVSVTTATIVKNEKIKEAADWREQMPLKVVAAYPGIDTCKGTSYEVEPCTHGYKIYVRSFCLSMECLRDIRARGSA